MNLDTTNIYGIKVLNVYYKGLETPRKATRSPQYSLFVFLIFYQFKNFPWIV